MTSQTIYLRLVCRFEPPPSSDGVPTVFGIIHKQHGLVLGELVGNAICFNAPVIGSVDDETRIVRMTGQYVHGSGSDRFLYLGLRRIDGDDWVRRWKVSLADITHETVSSLGAGKRLELSIDAPAFDKVWIRGQQWNTIAI